MTPERLIPNRYPSPKQEFQKVKRNVERHNELLMVSAFNEAIEVAKAEYVRQLGSVATVDPHTSMMNFQRIIGMEDFLKVFYNLGQEVVLPARMADPDNLPEPPLKRPRRP